MPATKLSFWASAFGWGSTLALLWLALGRHIPVDWLFWFAFGFFALMGALGGLISTAPR